MSLNGIRCTCFQLVTAVISMPSLEGRASSIPTLEFKNIDLIYLCKPFCIAIDSLHHHGPVALQDAPRRAPTEEAS
jgi:hypothetical protein